MNVETWKGPAEMRHEPSSMNSPWSRSSLGRIMTRRMTEAKEWL